MNRRRVLAGLVLVVLFAAGAGLALCQAPEEGERYAFLVGVRKYDKNELRDLRYSDADVTALAEILKKAGYQEQNIVLMTQARGAEDDRFLPRAEQIRRELSLLLRGLREKDCVIVVFSGHGVQFRNESEVYFCAAGTHLADKSTLVSLTEVYKQLEKCKAGFKLLLSDACRKDPQSSNSKARAEVDLESVTRPQRSPPPGGVAALFSCSEGEESFESDGIGHGVFLHFVVKGMQGEADLDGDGQVTLAELEEYTQKKVYDYVRAEFGRAQQPERSGTTRRVALVRLERPKELREITNSIGMKLVRIEPGKFLMGSPESEEGRSPDETQHEVEITKPFYLGKYSVTAGQFRAFVEDSGYKTDAEQNDNGGWGYDAETKWFAQKPTYSWRQTGF